MEVSSHAIDLHRVDGCDFAAAAFTNLTQDHLDYHHTLEEYFSVKRRLFTEFNAGAHVVNVDDAMGSAMAAEIGAEWTVGRRTEAVVRSRNEELDADGTTFVLDTPLGRELVRLPLAGAYNVSNALVAAGCALAVGRRRSTRSAEGLRNAPQVPGRLQRIDCGQPFSVVVDYAHTPDSLQKAIGAVRAVTEGSVIVVFGCGGDRDPDKRPLMGAAAGRSADVAIVTSDNPRSEDPVGIILQIEDGLRETRGVVRGRGRPAHALSVARSRWPSTATACSSRARATRTTRSSRTARSTSTTREVAREAAQMLTAHRWQARAGGRRQARLRARRASVVTGVAIDSRSVRPG